MTLDRKSVTEMSKLIALMNASDDTSVSDAEYTNVARSSVSSGSISEAARAATSDKDKMKEILSRLNAAQDVVATKAQTNRVLMEAIDTVKTDDGVMIGHMSIVENEGHYDVYDTSLNKKIAEDLSLYDAAYGIAKLLYEGAMINDVRIKTILFQESEFSKHVNDVSIYKNNIRKTTDARKKMILEDRSNVSYQAAVSSKKIIKEIVRNS